MDCTPAIPQLPHPVHLQSLSHARSPPRRPATQDLEASSGHALAPPATTLAFRSVTVEGYLSFKEEVTYPLGNRGLVVVTGRVEDTLEAGG